ncbi:DUF2550 domain-containing protein [Embleya sp. NBC_00896]|uniref:DUF2550 domain-containing protein n=1 Tax=Embleya sp. NBC_00896 TaxID=2975961 RepID=UPI003866049E|nr:DUF2550 domain-containing protein [Embleya sp. NBC_00896]
MVLVVLSVVLAVVVVLVVGVAAFALRRRLIQRPGGTFDCSLRMRPPVTVAGEAGETSAASPGQDASGGAASSSPSHSAEGDPAAPSADPDHGKGWVFGIARYSGDRIEWFRVFSYAPRPRRVLQRGGIHVIGRREPAGQEELALLAGAVILVCEHDGARIELALSDDALTGFLAWLEAAPPGQRVNVA